MKLKNSIGFLVLNITCVFSSIFAEENYLFFSPQMRSTYLQGYTDKEKWAIDQDLQIVRNICLPERKLHHRAPIYVATAGGSGARKTTILERCLKENPLFSDCAYIDPDSRGLKLMVNTYHSQSLSALTISEYIHYSSATKAAYEKWRDASNYIAYNLLEEALAQKRDIAHGTTSTGEHVPKMLSKIKEAGYEIIMLLCGCDDSLRQKAVHYQREEQKFYQSTPEDVLSKSKVFPKRMPTYFVYADILYLYWSEDLGVRERLAAIFQDGKVQILDSDAYARFINKFETHRAMLVKEGENLPSWNEMVDLYRVRYLK